MPTDRWTWRAGAVGLALAVALGAGSAQADSVAHNGWQCTARSESVSVYYWLTKPQTEPGVTITDSRPVYETTDTSFEYGLSPANGYFYFEVKLGTDHRIARGDALVAWQAVTVEIGDGAKALASGKLDTTRELNLINADAIPVVTAISNPATTNLFVRLIDGAGQPLASYTVPVAGFGSAAQAAAAMMGKEGTGGIGKSCP
jgi:hypothetical protein